MDSHEEPMLELPDIVDNILKPVGSPELFLPIHLPVGIRRETR